MRKLLSSIKEYLLNSKKISELNENLIEKLEKIQLNENTKIEMDSRKIEQGDIFFAINNGNNYVVDVLKKNPALIICDIVQNNLSDERVVYVEDTVYAMQEIANVYRKFLGLKVIGITGSNGKTSTKDILYSILSSKYKTVKTMGNYNTQMGVPYTIFKAKEDTQCLVLEMGMSDYNQINRLCEVAEPDYGIITNIGLSHMETLKSRDNVFKAKGEMIKHVDPNNLFLCSDDEYLRKVKSHRVGFSKIEKKYEQEIENFIIENYKEDYQGISFEVNSECYRSSLHGIYNANNIALAVLVAKKIGMTHEEIQKGLDNCEITPMRFQKIEWEGLRVINDAYNASPVSMKLGLETFVKIYEHETKIAVLGDMLELGAEEHSYHVKSLENANELKFKKIFLYGERMKKALEELKINSDKYSSMEIFTDKKAIKEEILKLKDLNPVIFLKGSRSMSIEEVLK